MNKKIMKAVGLGDKVKLFEEGKCTSCEKEVNKKEFKDQLSRKEYTLSGMCQECQDGYFK